MDQAEKTMLDNLYKNTGKTLEEWIVIVKKENFGKHTEILKFLKEQYLLTHGFANLVALKSKGTDAGSVENKDELIEKQYKGKEHFKPIYDQLIKIALQLGKDVEIAPKNANVSLRRKKQFALLHPITKTRFELGINLKGHPSQGKLEAIITPNAMCSHRINLVNLTDIDTEVIEWIGKAYNNAV